MTRLSSIRSSGAARSSCCHRKSNNVTPSLPATSRIIQPRHCRYPCPLDSLRLYRHWTIRSKRYCWKLIARGIARRPRCPHTLHQRRPVAARRRRSSFTMNPIKNSRQLRRPQPLRTPRRPLTNQRKCSPLLKQRRLPQVGARRQELRALSNQGAADSSISIYNISSRNLPKNEVFERRSRTRFLRELGELTSPSSAG